jgi:hypothetical protein
MLNGVNTTICYLYRLIEGNKARLERGQLNQKLNRFAIVFFQFCNVGSAFSQSSEVISIWPIRITLKYREKDT